MARKPTPTADGEALRKTGKKWLDRIEAAGKLEKDWLDDAELATSTYRGKQGDQAKGSITRHFNILFANTETIVPAVINSPPAPDIRRRFGDDDPVATSYAELLERAIRIQVDDSKLQTEMEAGAQDGFLAGRGLIRLRFKSDFISGETTDQELSELQDQEDDKKPEDGEKAAAPNETATNERIDFEAVSWKDFRHGKAKRWNDVPWVAFRHSMACDDLEDFADAELLKSQTDATDKPWDKDTDRDVWEVWAKRGRIVLFIDAGSGKVLKKVDDPLGLSNFFPIPAPIQPIETTGELTPVNPYSIYLKLAEELNETSRRIAIITEQLKLKGWYAISPTDVQAVLDADDNEFVPIADAEIWAAKGGLQNAVLFWPIEKLAQVLMELYKLRDQSKQAIYEITGISDIVRGASKANETLGAQQIKSQWGSLRIQKMQRMIERAARDLFVMMAEIIPAKFSPETLQKMTGIQLVPTEQDMTPAIPQPPQVPQGAPPEVQQQAMQQAEMQAQQAEQARMQKLQKIMQLRALMGEKASTYFRIDVESDSTVRADLTQQKQEATEFMGAASQYFTAVAPLVEQGALPLNIAVEIFGSFSRLFNLGKTVDDALEELIQLAKGKAGHPPQPKPDPAAEEAKRKAEDAQVDRQIKIQDAEADRNIKKADADLDAQIKTTELRIKQTELNMRNAQFLAMQRQMQMQQFGASGGY